MTTTTLTTTRKRRYASVLLVTSGKVLLFLIIIQVLIIFLHLYLPKNAVLAYIIQLANMSAHSPELNVTTNKMGGANCVHKPWEREDGIFHLRQDKTTYFINSGNYSCLIEGTDMPALTESGRHGCACVDGWHGQWCSVPDVVHRSDYPFTKYPLQLRQWPRRLVSAFPFNVEFEMLEARLADLGDLVDVFLILESNYTAYGEQKPLRLLDRLKAGGYSDVACKLVHVFLPFFPEAAHSNGWIADDLLRNYIVQQGVAKQLRNFSRDDIFWLSDADEVPSREAILFLKLHDGYPEPIGIYLKLNTFGFFWTRGSEQTHVTAGLTFGLLRHVFWNNAIRIRSASSYLANRRLDLNSYLKAGGKVKEWSIGSQKVAAGWHCSWCGEPHHILAKLTNAQNGDFPRWGDYPEKCNLTYIRGLIKEGMWFNDKDRLVRAVPVRGHLYVPPYIQNNPHRFRYLLVNPYRGLTARRSYLTFW